MRIYIFFGLFFFSSMIVAENLRPGFEIEEYLDCLRINSHFESPGIDSSYLTTGESERFERVYSSPVVGFDNCWEMWVSADSVVVVSVRASVMTATSWMANFHAALVGANGNVHLGKDYRYKLAENEDAKVHVGWLVAMLSLSEDIVQKLDSMERLSYKNVLITGHSQGGAIAYLLTSYLRYLQIENSQLVAIKYKTYCSAAPKPGDYNYAVDYEYLTRGGWSFNVVSADDWVPEVPLSVQRLNDFQPTNPFTHIDELTGSMGMSKGDKLKVKLLFNQLSSPLDQSAKRLTKYLGTTLGKMLTEEISDYKVPDLDGSSNFARCGVTIVLRGSAEYHSRHPRETPDAFEHHAYKAYEELAIEYANSQD